jgi:hypothetical protein
MQLLESPLTFLAYWKSKKKRTLSKQKKVEAQREIGFE